MGKKLKDLPKMRQIESQKVIEELPFWKALWWYVVVYITIRRLRLRRWLWEKPNNKQ